MDITVLDFLIIENINYLCTVHVFLIVCKFVCVHVHIVLDSPVLLTSGRVSLSIPSSISLSLPRQTHSLGGGVTGMGSSSSSSPSAALSPFSSSGGYRDNRNKINNYYMYMYMYVHAYCQKISIMHTCTCAYVLSNQLHVHVHVYFIFCRTELHVCLVYAHQYLLKCYYLYTVL